MSGNIFNYFSKIGKNRPLAGNSSSLQPTAGGMQSTAVGYVGKELRLYLVLVYFWTLYEMEGIAFMG